MPTGVGYEAEELSHSLISFPKRFAAVSIMRVFSSSTSFDFRLL